MNKLSVSLTPTGFKPTSFQWRQIRHWLLTVFEQCEECGSTNNLQVHHLDKDHGNTVFNNLRLLCQQCHGAFHIGKTTKPKRIRPEWQGRKPLEVSLLAGVSLRTVYRWESRRHLKPSHKENGGGRPTLLEASHYKRLPQAAEALGIHQDTLRVYLMTGRLPPVPKNKVGVWLFSLDWIENAKNILGFKKDGPEAETERKGG